MLCAATTSGNKVQKRRPAIFPINTRYLNNMLECKYLEDNNLNKIINHDFTRLASKPHLLIWEGKIYL